MEIEARVKVKSLEEIRKKLKDMGAIFGSVRKQSDSIYKEKGKETETQRPGSYILRVRRTGTSSTLTLKMLTEIAGSWKEYEVRIADPEEMEHIIAAIGFAKVLELNKTREHAKLGDITLCLDDIKELGLYVELEIIADEAHSAKQKITHLLQRLGFSEQEKSMMVMSLFYSNKKASNTKARDNFW